MSALLPACKKDQCEDLHNKYNSHTLNTMVLPLLVVGVSMSALPACKKCKEFYHNYNSHILTHWSYQ